MDPYAIDIARRRHAEGLERAREERLAAAASLAVPSAWGRVALRVADLMVRTGNGLQSRYRRPAVSGGNRGRA